MFEVGRTYKRRDLHLQYGGQRQGGISTPDGRPFLLLFTGTGEHYGYHDGWDANGVFLYSGEGQVGDMQFTGGNKALRDHATNGKDLHLFEQLGRGQVRYRGCFSCSSWDFREAKDRLGKPRKAIVFHLVPLDDAPGAPVTSPPRTPQPRQVLEQPLEELRKKALEAATEASQSNSKQAKRLYYERSEAVRDYVLRRANGICEACGKPAPFQRPDATPYIEPHHTRRLSDGGPDHPRWVGGVCPNCHREIHYGANGQALNRRLQECIGTIESDES